MTYKPKNKRLFSTAVAGLIITGILSMPAAAADTANTNKKAALEKPKHNYNQAVAPKPAVKKKVEKKAEKKAAKKEVKKEAVGKHNYNQPKKTEMKKAHKKKAAMKTDAQKEAVKKEETKKWYQR